MSTTALCGRAHTGGFVTMSGRTLALSLSSSTLPPSPTLSPLHRPFPTTGEPQENAKLRMVISYFQRLEQQVAAML